MVNSVYNFVKAKENKDVFKPNWYNAVSHDIPFKDGESGEINFTIEAQTDIFISEGNQNSNKIKEFEHVEINGIKKYFIPATSLKGMFRNVLEILSQSYLNPNLVNNHHHSYRDLKNDVYTQYFSKDKMKGGFLSINGEGKWEVEMCEVAFIHHNELKKKNIPFRDLFLEKNPNNEFKLAIGKYEYLQQKNITLNHTFITEEKSISQKQNSGPLTRTVASFSPNGKQGTLVFTGQPGKRQETNVKKASGKVHEFVFFKNGQTKVLDEKLVEMFLFAYLDHDPINISKDWKEYKKQLKNGKKIPIFISEENDKIQHFGLSYLYKLPYKNNVHALNPITEYEKKYQDLVHAIFGASYDKEELKGRIFFKHAFASNEVKVGELKKEILASPKASYYPFYLEQKKIKHPLNTYDSKISLKGFKRYPVHQNIKTGEYDLKQLENDKVFSHFKPLKKGVQFKAKLRFHNLKKEEIGALLSAISFHGKNDVCFHSLGGAKAYGYGKIAIKDITLRDTQNSKEDYLGAFEDIITKHNPNWLKDESVLQLLEMAGNINDNTLKYPKIKDFGTFKGTKKEEPIVLDYPNQLPIKPLTFSQKPQEKLVLDMFNKFADLSTFLNKIFNEYGGKFDVANQLLIADKIEFLFHNHKDSGKKLSKNYDWDNNISKWLSQEKIVQLKQKLNINF